MREWSDILDRLEADIAVAVSGGEPVPWSPPVEAGPLPPALADRARRLLDAQLESVSILGKIRNDALAHLDALSTVPGSRDASRPLILDVQG
ncbi:hypothetical protein ACSBOX_17325 [Arthrobacter sp. KN11-1C]|uniref:hypothetical protein n=1 Tax=Arthrobacter sp. KN11-1C TaxID=3445774 RepID=UPI003F9F94B1